MVFFIVLNPNQFIMDRGESLVFRNFCVLFGVLYVEQEEDGSAA
jgi:hypothetical protein